MDAPEGMDDVCKDNNEELCDGYNYAVNKSNR